MHLASRNVGTSSGDTIDQCFRDSLTDRLERLLVRSVTIYRIAVVTDKLITCHRKQQMLSGRA